MDKSNTGCVFLVGAGPGDPELITCKGRRILFECDVIVYDNLVPVELIMSLPEAVEKVYVGKKAGRHTLPQDEINEIMVKYASTGKKVVRLKGGDPFVFGRGGEEAIFLKQHGIPFEVVPGITSGVAGPAYCGIPVTERDKASFVIFITGHKAEDKDSLTVNWECLGKARNGTLVIYMGVSELPNIVNKLLNAGMPGDIPAAAVERGTYPTQRYLVSTLEKLPGEVATADLKPPALFVVGDVVNLQETVNWIERKTLLGIRILITRPADQALEVYQQLRELGAEVLPFPTISTREGKDAGGWQSFDSIKSDKKWLLFTSENGVRYFVKQYLKKYEDIRGLAGFKIAAVGTGTARALREQRFTTDFIPQKATVTSLAKEMTEQIDVKGSVVVRVQGNLSDNTVYDVLSKAGAEIVPLTVYETYHPEWPEGMKEKIFDYPPDVIIFTSGSTAEGLAEMLSKKELEQITTGANIVSIGPSTSTKIKSLGMEVTIEAETHSIPGVIEALVTHSENNSLKRKI